MSSSRRENSLNGYDKVPLLAHGEDSSDEDDLLDLRRSAPGRPSRLKMKDDKLKTVKNEIKSTMSIMKNNISKVIDRGDRLEDLEAKSESFEMNAFNFKSGSTKLRQKLWWQNCKLKIILAFIVVAILLVIILPIAIKKKN
ncbi:vesicle-associated membrane protein 4-like [Rhopilema esculentum]|uniref:vesicle-associated membrane protein 4-like n=1 Tax=Rhopilema esculentum TaxID=499914 RepID=UPI0031D8E599